MTSQHVRTLIRSATVVDGTETPRYRADVLLTGGTISEISPAGSTATLPDADLHLDADGLVLSPGFIDMHAHSDLALLIEPDHAAKLTQGVTCEVLGQDGLSYAPVTDHTLPLIRQQIAGWNGDPGDATFSWRSVGDYLDLLDRGIATNAIYLVPHGTVRAAVLGWDDRSATPAEIHRMQRLVRTGLLQGAAGLSAGLTYPPGMYGDTAELVALCTTVAELGGYFSPHHRSYGAHTLDAYAEMVEISRRSGCPLHLAHAIMNFPGNEGRGPELLALLAAAAAEGLDISLDSYPYLAGATTLASLLPSWAAVTGPTHTLARLADPVVRQRIRHDLEVIGSDGCHGVPVDWDTIEISGVQHDRNADLVGLTVAQIGLRQGRPPFEVFVDLLVRDDLGTGILEHAGHEENVQAIMTHPRHTAGSDGLLVGAKPHPRAWGTFPRYLGHYCRELGLMSLEECIGHLAGRAARRLQLAGRGLVKTGYAADLVLFDPATVADRATYAEPRLPAVGIEHVLIGGRFAVRNGSLTGIRAGRSLRRRDRGHVW